MTTLKPVRRQVVSESVYEQLRDQIVRGRLQPGAALPAERVLCEALGVNRSAVREALKRLEQARLVSVRHGGSSRVLDYRNTAGLDLLGTLVASADDNFDPMAVRSVIEMRCLMAPDVARLAVERSPRELSASLADIVEAMEEAGDDVEELIGLAREFWECLVNASQNIAYRLAFNCLQESYDKCPGLFTELLTSEAAELDSYAAMADAARRRDARAAEASARKLLQGSERALDVLLRGSELSAAVAAH